MRKRKQAKIAREAMLKEQHCAEALTRKYIRNGFSLVPPGHGLSMITQSWIMTRYPMYYPVINNPQSAVIITNV